MRQSKQVSILCDTNILIYYMLCTPRFIKDVMKLFERCVEREVKLSCASLSLKDVFYTESMNITDISVSFRPTSIIPIS